MIEEKIEKEDSVMARSILGEKMFWSSRSVARTVVMFVFCNRCVNHLEAMYGILSTTRDRRCGFFLCSE